MDLTRPLNGSPNWVFNIKLCRTFKTEEYGIYHKQKEIVGEILKNEIVFSCHSERERERKKEFMYLKGTLSLSL
jgi:hypothetical protein